VLYDTSRDKAVAVAERIRQGFANAAKEVDSRPVGATVSIGLAYCHEATLDVADLLAQSDQALYLAKENGRNRVEVASFDMIVERTPEAHTASADSVAMVATRSAAA
jgi:diguanylate cyclase (GGDEF)-like protein